MARVRKGLSYVLGDTGNHENHILPINAMQLLAHTGHLFTGGRDGVVKVWSLDRQPEAEESPLPEEDCQDVNEQLLKLETAILLTLLQHKSLKCRYDSLAVLNRNTHFDWINDIKLVDKDRLLVTALADLSLKLIRLDTNDENDVHKFQNVHTDYVKKLSLISLQNLVVSGALDGAIAIWDLKTLKPILHFQNQSGKPHLPSSVYALANNQSNLISAGGPSNTINVYDRRISREGGANLIKRLVGHQDNVRCLLMNSDYILSGSSDSTVKLWDMRNFKVYKNFEMHDDPVWSLTTPYALAPGLLDGNADFSVFYSGDKAGNVVKTDLNYLSLYVPEEEMVEPTFSTSDLTVVDEKLGLCTLVAKACSPIVSLCVEKDTSIFASTYNALNRYYVPDTRQMAKYQYYRTCVDYCVNLDAQVDDDHQGVLEGTTTDQSDLNSEFYDIVSHLSMDTNNLDIQSSFSNYPMSVTNAEGEVDENAEYNSMFLCINGGPSTEFVNAYKEELKGLKTQETLTVDKTPVEILLNPIPASQVISIAFNSEAIERFPLSPKSIVAKKMLNNKRWMVVLYHNGDICIWDVFICQVIKSYPSKTGSDKRLSDDELKERARVMDQIAQENQTLDTFSNWCEVEIRSGKLLVSFVETSSPNVEIYYDEMVKLYPFMALDKNEPAKEHMARASDDERYPLALIFLNSIFHQYALYELKSDEKAREELRISATKLKTSGTGSEVDLSSVSSTVEETKRKRLFSRKSSKANVSLLSAKPAFSPAPSVSSAISDLADDPLTLTETSSISDQNIAEDSILKLILQNRQKYIDFYGQNGSKRVAPSEMFLYSNDIAVNGKDEGSLYCPFIPVMKLPGNLLIIVFENSQDLGNYRDVCSFHLDEITELNYPVQLNSTKCHLVQQLRQTLPKWIGNPILFNKFPQKEWPKVAFQLFEADYSKYPADKKIGGKAQKKIKRLPPLESSLKLTSQNMLRVNKVLLYVTEKFESRTSEMKEKKRPAEWLELECRGQILEPTMTLQTIKTKIWKSSSDIELFFRRKFDS
ncbi:hypothetical protein C7M61_003359 [Candidozyma pseudohaemuli]|uniref:Uncharacterized protein n=1 Tax=Candidozyma pseudohaemuli TaxID=418784 RepID=A0A2P7YNW8_9ASCO|nr:hypothetical protein C7M61_003359 [[Candida] pseudohaemulonii]PSK37652.1 hypothetical protein C7M61_003359 [[Candida] pseudohaemulonii]